MPSSAKWSTKSCASYDYVLAPVAGEQGFRLGDVMLLSRRQREPQGVAQSALPGTFVLNPPRLRPRACADCPPFCGGSPSALVRSTTVLSTRYSRSGSVLKCWCIRSQTPRRTTGRTVCRWCSSLLGRAVATALRSDPSTARPRQTAGIPPRRQRTRQGNPAGIAKSSPIGLKVWLYSPWGNCTAVQMSTLPRFERSQRSQWNHFDCSRG